MQEALPFFSKVNLRESASNLRSRGFRVAMKQVQVGEEGGVDARLGYSPPNARKRRAGAYRHLERSMDQIALVAPDNPVSRGSASSG